MSAWLGGLEGTASWQVPSCVAQDAVALLHYLWDQKKQGKPHTSAKRIKLTFPRPEDWDSSRREVITFNSLTMDGVVQIVYASGGAALIRADEYPPEAWNVPGGLVLQDNTLYVIKGLTGHPTEEEVVHGVVKALRDTLVASSQGVGLQQRAVDWLKERGHTGVRPLCSDTLKDDEGIPRAQIDAGATAERCAVIVVMKPRFTKSYVQAAKDTFDGIKQLIADGAQSVLDLQGKQLHFVVCVEALPSLSCDLEDALLLCKQLGMDAWLPNYCSQ